MRIIGSVEPTADGAIARQATLVHPAQGCNAHFRTFFTFSYLYLYLYLSYLSFFTVVFRAQASGYCQSWKQLYFQRHLEAELERWAWQQQLRCWDASTVLVLLVAMLLRWRW